MTGASKQYPVFSKLVPFSEKVHNRPERVAYSTVLVIMGRPKLATVQAVRLHLNYDWSL